MRAELGSILVRYATMARSVISKCEMSMISLYGLLTKNKKKHAKPDNKKLVTLYRPSVPKKVKTKQKLSHNIDEMSIKKVKKHQQQKNEHFMRSSHNRYTIWHGYCEPYIHNLPLLLAPSHIHTALLNIILNITDGDTEALVQLWRSHSHSRIRIRIRQSCS